MRAGVVQLVLVSTVLFVSFSVHGQNQGTCKEPVVEKRLLADDVRFASPFYVIALPRNQRTEQMDNVCYTYFENDNGAFFHVMSITFKNGSNTYYTYTKGDITNRIGLAEGTALTDSQCIYHDYTLTPICNVTVFILYRCFIEGNCGNIDIGITPEVDVRVVLAANPHVSKECLQETESSLKDTSTFDGGNYVILPQKRNPQCITKYNNLISIGYDRAVGSKEVTEGSLVERLGGDDASAVNPVQPQPTQNTWNNQNTNFGNAPVPKPTTGNRTPFNPYGTQVKGHTSTYATPLTGTQANTRPGYATSSSWAQNNGQWYTAQSPWGQTVRPGAETHYHMWTSPTGPTKTTTGTRKNPNVYYHIHSWDNPPPGCCRCN